MAICRLCLEGDPDKKNAHLIPHFLIKTAINEGGSKEREKELVFGLSPTGLVDVYFGRDVSVEKISEVLGREETDEEIAARQNPFARDHLVCTPCEKKLSALEGYIAQEFYNPLSGAKQFETIQDSAERPILVADHPSPGLYALFVYSIFWRASAGDYGGFRLHPRIEEKLRQLLVEHLSLKVNDMIESVSKLKKLPFPIISSYAPTPQDADTTQNSITAESTRFPYFITANNMTFQLFEKERQVKASVQHLHGLSGMIDRLASCMFDTSRIKVALLTEDQGKSLVSYPLLEFASRASRLLRGAFGELCERVFGGKANITMENRYIEHFMREGVPIGARYTVNHMAQSAMDTFIDFGFAPKP